MDLIKKLINIEFLRYVIAGGFATIVDWATYYCMAIVFSFHYQFALIVAFSMGSAANYAANKFFTFKCKSKKIVGQVSVHFTISICSLIMSMGIMYLLIDFSGGNKMTGRIITTIIMLALNYLMHKYITFNKRVFT